MNKGILGFPRNAALQARSVTAQTVTVGNRLNVPGASAASTGIKLADEQDLGSLFRPMSYTAVQSVSTSGGSGFGNANCSSSLSASVSGGHLSISISHNCNCNCACDCTSCP